MIRFAVIGTNWITRQFVEAAHESGKYKLTAVYSRSLEQAQHFANDFSVEHLFTSLEAMAESDAIDAVYIASPNSLHFSQTQLFLSHKIHVICEKPLASNLAEVDAAIACARENQVVLFEAFKTASLPNFHLLRQALPKVGKLRKVFFNYCQYSSRYQRYLDGENPNTFNPAFSNGSIMDIGFYCLASAVALFGEPKSVQATASLLASGVDAHGVVVMDYGDFSVTKRDRWCLKNCLNARKFALFRVAARCRISPNRSILIPCSTKQSCSLPWWMSIWWIIQGWRSVASPPNC